MKQYICSREKVSFTRHDYRFTYRKIGNRFVLLAYALYSSQYILQYLSSSASCNSSLALSSIRPNTRKKTFALKLVYRFPITIKCCRAPKEYFLFLNFVLTKLFTYNKVDKLYVIGKFVFEPVYRNILHRQNAFQKIPNYW